MGNPGYKTSELYVALAGSIVALLQLYGVFSQEEGDAVMRVVGAFVSVLPSIVYIISRTLLKIKQGG